MTLELGVEILRRAGSSGVMLPFAVDDRLAHSMLVSPRLQHLWSNRACLPGERQVWREEEEKRT